MLFVLSCAIFALNQLNKLKPSLSSDLNIRATNIQLFGNYKSLRFQSLLSVNSIEINVVLLSIMLKLNQLSASISTLLTESSSCLIKLGV